ncbi:MAG TPA: alpha amylase C-terminal domain-containing protein, partial [Pirellulales bacterium]|nr:alpha amylase C-terminal domain-containing protein [Pirellulales bacterium]
GFEWLDCHNYDQSTLAFLRKAKDASDHLIVACNFTPMPRITHRLGVPENCWYEEISNSDSIYYGGSNLGNGPGVMAEQIPWGDRPYSIPVTLPPLGTVILKPRR